MNHVYDEKFYEGMAIESLNSARIYMAYLWVYIQPDSVLDVGCGRGAWLKACHELGSNQLFGLDGSWNNQSLMIDDNIKFRNIDLNQPFVMDEKIDLVITLEVAEHLVSDSSSQFIECLTNISDAIVFSAAFTGQGGTNHINEQPHSFWANLFNKNGYVAFDFFRPVFWGDERVGFWYRQNTFLYLKKDSDPYKKINDAGFYELKQNQFMDCVHPRLYEVKCGEGVGFKVHLKEIVPSLFRAAKRKLNSNKTN